MPRRNDYNRFVLDASDMIVTGKKPVKSAKPTAKKPAKPAAKKGGRR